MDDYFKNGMQIASTHFEKFLADLKAYEISNIYINNIDLKLIGSQSLTKYPSIKHIGNGIILELNKIIKYEFSGGFGIGDYFLKIQYIEKLEDPKKYTSVNETEMISLKNLIGKQISWIITNTFHGDETVLRTIEMNFKDGKDKIMFVGSNFETSNKKESFHYYDGAWIITDEILVNNLEIL